MNVVAANAGVAAQLVAATRAVGAASSALIDAETAVNRDNAAVVRAERSLVNAVEAPAQARAATAALVVRNYTSGTALPTSAGTVAQRRLDAARSEARSRSALEAKARREATALGTAVAAAQQDQVTLTAAQASAAHLQSTIQANLGQAASVLATAAPGVAAADAAETQLGVPYVWGGTTPKGTPGRSAGLDCSGLVQWAWRQAGVPIPRTTEDQASALTPVAFDQLLPGDLLFYLNLDHDDAIDHVVMYVGSGPFGTNTVIAAPYTGVNVRYESLSRVGLVVAARPGLPITPGSTAADAARSTTAIEAALAARPGTPAPAPPAGS
jgi:cell wall-associated NlpC family hydrolase